MRKDVFVDGLKKETFNLDETEQKIVLKDPCDHANFCDIAVFQYRELG